MVSKIVIFTLFAVAVVATASAQDGATPNEVASEVVVAADSNPAGALERSDKVKLTRRQKYDRGLAFDTKTPSMPKGMWIVGTNVSYSQQASNDYRILVISKLNMQGSSFSITPMVHYVFANNQSVGVRFAYKRNWLDIGDLQFSLTPTLSEMLFGDGSLRYSFQNHTYMGYLSYRYYVALGTSKRFLIFNEVQLGVGGSQQRELSGWNDDKSSYKTGTYQRSINFRAGLAPGATFFVTNSLACEVQMGLFGYELKKMSQYGTNLPASELTTSNISTRFDFLSVAFGMTLYL